MNDAWALVPIKPPSGAKSRLAPLLTAEERAELSRHMARDVLAALRATPGLAGIAVLAPGDSAAALAAEFGCRALRDDPALGFNANLQRAVAHLAAGGARTVVIIPCDLPGLTAEDCTALLDAHDTGATLVAAARDGGTNALALTPPDAVECLFGPDSARRHLEAAGRAGCRAARIDIPGFARDIDTVDDVLGFCDEPRGGGARQYLESSGICVRLRQRGARTA